jgi:hypothetical protein
MLGGWFTSHTSLTTCGALNELEHVVEPLRGSRVARILLVWLKGSCPSRSSGQSSKLANGRMQGLQCTQNSSSGCIDTLAGTEGL